MRTREPDLFDAARKRRDDGMELVEDNANQTAPGWSAAAYAAIAEFCRERPYPFLLEDVRQWSASRGIAAPHDRRAWGAVIRRAAKHGLVRKVGYAPAASSNMSPKVQWCRT